MQAGPAITLPEPDSASASHGARVAAHLHETIEAAGGSVSFATYMHEALYAPGLGYYAAGARKFGEAGDFITAPEVSPVFGRVVGQQVASVLSQVDRPRVLEIGAGTGRLAVDVLGKLAELDAVPDRYLILEVSPDLQQRQQALLGECLPTLADRVDWIDALPQDHRGVVLANEVLDALPVERFRCTTDGVLQARVTSEAGGFRIQERPAGSALEAAVRSIEAELGDRLPDGYVSEVCLALPGWISELAGSLQEGLAFLFDYGVSRAEYYAPERNGGWLRCHFRHRAHNDPLILTGIQDITAWVDFTAVASAGLDSGLDVAGYATQAHFLLHGGLAAELGHLADLAPDEQIALSGQVKTLTLPAEMGEHFKCLGLRRGAIETPAGLAGVDRAAQL